MDPAYGAASVSRASAFPSSRGRPAAGLYPIFPCADGHVRVVVLAPRQWRAMRAWLGEPAAFQDARYDTITARLDAAAELHGLYAALFAGKTKDAIASEGQARGVPIAPVLDVSEVLASAALRRRAERSPTPRSRLACAAGCRAAASNSTAPALGFRHRAPEPGEHNHLLELSPGERPVRSAAARAALARRPLDGLRVVDFGIIVIGNEIGRALADQGADVIKVENRAFPDAARVGYGGGLSHSFVAGSRNKRSFGVDLRTPEGAALLKRLVAERRRRARELQAGHARAARARLRDAARRQPGRRDAQHERARVDRTVEWLARLRPDRALRLGHRRPLALSRRRARASASRPRSTPTTTARACARRRCWRR